MRALLIGREYPVRGAGGGIGRVFQELFESRREFEMEMVISTQFKEKIYLPEKVAHFIKTRGKDPIDKIIYGKNFKKFISHYDQKYDIYNFHFPSGIFPYYYSKDVLKNKEVVITVHTTTKGLKYTALDKTPTKYLSGKEILYRDFTWRWLAKIEEKCFKNSVNITAVSEKISDELDKFYGVKDVEVIKNGINENRIIYNKKTSGESDTMKILYIGRHTAQKGIPFALEAFKGLKEDENFTLYIAGKGYLTNKIKKIATKIDKRRIKFLGFVPHEKLNELYNSVDALLMPSLYEGLPMVALEGIAAGLPILGFKGAVLDEIVCEENKQLINETLDIDGLRNSIKFLIENKDIRKKIGKKNRERFLKHFTADRMAREYYKYFKKVSN